MNFGDAAVDYRTHRQTFPEEFFARVPLGGDLLDVGTGTGALAQGYQARGARVVALDVSPAMLKQAIGLTRRVAARAECLPFADATFDVVIAGQCWHWFDRDLAAREAKRVLRRSGHLVIAHFNYLPFPGTPAELSERLLLERHPQWAMAGVQRMSGRWDRQLKRHGFEPTSSVCFDVEVSYSHEGWRGRMRACNGIIAMGPERGSEYDRALAVALQRFPNPFPVQHEVFALICRISS